MVWDLSRIGDEQVGSLLPLAPAYQWKHRSSCISCTGFAVMQTAGIEAMPHAVGKRGGGRGKGSVSMQLQPLTKAVVYPEHFYLQSRELEQRSTRVQQRRLA